MNRIKDIIKKSIGRAIESGVQITDNAIVNGYVTVIVKRVDGSVEVKCRDRKNLLVIEGRDKLHEAGYQNAGATQAPFNFIGLSTDVGTPVNTDTRTTWELIEITGGGFGRVQASTRNHTAGTNTTDLIHTFTAGVIHTGVRKAGVLDRITTGDGFLGHENTFPSETLQIGDQILITWTFVIG